MIPSHSAKSVSSPSQEVAFLLYWMLKDILVCGEQKALLTVFQGGESLDGVEDRERDELP